MTRVAALYDIHANLPALEAVLDEVGDADTILVGGDFSRGPMPVETVDRLRSLGERARFIRGNADRPAAGEGAWEMELLGRERLDFLAGLPETVTMDVEGLGGVLFCHGSPRSDEDIVTAVTPLRAPMPAKSKAFSTWSSSPTQLHRPETCCAAYEIA